jgi:hypothetical protein
LLGIPNDELVRTYVETAVLGPGHPVEVNANPLVGGRIDGLRSLAEVEITLGRVGKKRVGNEAERVGKITYEIMPVVEEEVSFESQLERPSIFQGNMMADKDIVKDQGR